MKALVCRSLEERRLHWQSVAEPQVEVGQLLIQVKAASVNFPDALLLQGKHQRVCLWAKLFLPWIDDIDHDAAYITTARTFWP